MPRGVAWLGRSSSLHSFLSYLVPSSILGPFSSCLILYLVLPSTCATGSLLNGAFLSPAGALMPWLLVPSVRCPVSFRVKSPLLWPVPACAFITPPCSCWVTNRLGYLVRGLRSAWGKFHH